MGRFLDMLNNRCQTRTPPDVSVCRNGLKQPSRIKLKQFADPQKRNGLPSKAIEIRIRAERKAGQLLAEKERGKPGGNGSNQYVSKSTSVQPEPDCPEYQRAKQNGKISDTQAHRRQQLATIPEDEFERRLAPRPDCRALPGFDLHPLKGKLKGLWAVSVSGNWRVVFRFENGNAYDVDLIDYH